MARETRGGKRERERARSILRRAFHSFPRQWDIKDSVLARRLICQRLGPLNEAGERRTKKQERRYGGEGGRKTERERGTVSCLQFIKYEGFDQRYKQPAVFSVLRRETTFERKFKLLIACGRRHRGNYRENVLDVAIFNWLAGQRAA